MLTPCRKAVGESVGVISKQVGMMHDLLSEQNGKVKQLSSSADWNDDNLTKLVSELGQIH